MSRRPYVRPMSRTWYMDHPYYRRYMVREASCVFDALYAVNLFVGLVQLSRGAETWNSWLALQAHPLMILFATVTLCMTLYHVITYFDMTPRVLPQIVRKMVKDSVVNKLMYLGLAGVSVLIFAVTLIGL